MNFQVLTIFLLFIVPNSAIIYADNIENNLENYSAPIEKFRLDSYSKIHPILVKWQTSDDPEEFAKKNNLSYTENKVGVFIYLKSAEYRTKIPLEINVKGFDDKIVVAIVSSEQLDKLDNLDFVERVTPPILVRTPPIPQVEIPETPTLEENRYGYLVWIVFGTISIIAIGIFKKRKKPKGQN